MVKKVLKGASHEKNRRGFTLIELLFVSGILATLFVVGAIIVVFVIGIPKWISKGEAAIQRQDYKDEFDN